MLDELLRVGIEGICNILLGDNRPDRLALHLFDELYCILEFKGPIIEPFSTGQDVPMKVIKFGISGTVIPRYASGHTFHLSARSTLFGPTTGKRG